LGSSHHPLGLVGLGEAHRSDDTKNGSRGDAEKEEDFLISASPRLRVRIEFGLAPATIPLAWWALARLDTTLRKFGHHDFVTMLNPE
jgi:hypothetical protein